MREREKPQKHDGDRRPEQGYQGLEQVGEEHSGEDMEEAEHHRDEEEESEKQDNRQR